MKLPGLQFDANGDTFTDLKGNVLRWTKSITNRLYLLDGSKLFLISSSILLVNNRECKFIIIWSRSDRKIYQSECSWHIHMIRWNLTLLCSCSSCTISNQLSLIFYICFIVSAILSFCDLYASIDKSKCTS